jgi:hypothetical protein
MSVRQSAAVLLAAFFQLLPAFAADSHHATIDAGGRQVGNGDLTMNGSLGGLGGWSGIAGSEDFAKAGYAGQIHDVASLVVLATPGLAQEGGSSQLSAVALLDDATHLRLAGADVRWFPSDPPLISITADGLVTAASLASTNVAAFRGSFLGVLSSAALLQINRPPLALSDAAGRIPNRSLKILVQKLVANDQDPDGDGLNLSLATATTANGASIRITGDWVIYQASAGFNDADSFDYSIHDGRGGSATASVAIIIQPESENVTLNQLQIEVLPGTGDRRIRFVGIPGRAYTIHATSALEPPAWTMIGAAVAGSNGLYDFIDTDTASHPIRFYRSLSQ